MPLVRFEVRNEYGLGQPELYRGANREDPKAVLDGVAVAGLVGILRQLGDLADFAAEVFHGLQEQVMSTASRSHKLMVRVQNIEAALPPLEKAVLTQTSHLHFAYTAGSEWHPRIRNEQNLFIYSDLPRFIMDSYEECRDPPRLHLLDKFDTGGPGSCLKRYSDPTFFRRVSCNSSEADAEKVQKEKKGRKSRKKRSARRNVDLQHSAPVSNNSGRMQFTSTNVNGRTSPSHTASTNDMTLKSDLGDHSNSFDSRNGSGYAECVFHLNSDVLAEEKEPKKFSSDFVLHNDIRDSDFPDRKPAVTDDAFLDTSTPGRVVPSSSRVEWDEKTEIVDLSGHPSDEHETLNMFAKDLYTETEDANQISQMVAEGFDIEPGDSHEGQEMIARDFDVETKDAQESLEMLTEDFGIEKEDQRIVDHTGPNQLHTVFDDVTARQSGYSNEELDEVESEPDNYMDALNTIESESETDAEFQTKCEVEKFPSDSNNGASNEKHEVTAYVPEHEVAAHIPEHEVADHVPEHEVAAHIPEHEVADHIPEHEVATHFPDQYPLTYEYDAGSSISSLSSKDFPAEQTPRISTKPSNSDHVQDVVCSASSDAFDVSRAESAVTDRSSSGSAISNTGEPLGNDAANSSCGTQESQAESSSVSSVTFWTNGGLLGLEPSKPPDFALSKAANHDNVTKSNGVAVCQMGPTVNPGSGEEKGKLGRLVKDPGTMTRDMNSKFSMLWQKDQDAKVQQSVGSLHNNQFSHDDVSELDVASSVTPPKQLPVDTNAKSMSNEADQDVDENSSPVYGFGRRLLGNGLHRKMPHVLDSKPQIASLLEHTALDERDALHNIAFHATPGKAFKEQFEHKSYIDSITSSPPLEHMKISFHPVDGLESSKLKLTFPDASHNNESVRDMFPSFQLVPEPGIQLHDVGSVSDDDTFCRSSPYESDDGLRHHSDSDSEQWESGESPENKDIELYDAWGRISPGESISSSVEPVEMGYGADPGRGLRGMQFVNGADPSISASSLDLPSFEALNPVVPVGEGNFGKSNQLDVQQHMESTPSPPPLPPAQWRAKLHCVVSEDKQLPIPAHKLAFDPVISQVIKSQQQKPSPAKEEQPNEGSIEFRPESKGQNEQKWKRQGEVKQPANGNGMDEKEDFLQQIRSKSFSLRRTVTTKPTFASAPTTNDNVTAILVKANAIRQAVGSDDGEDDDSWSDT
ncbi:hypothetical protein Tsubulata_014728 [Turnera subulata]|uniref:Protein SCAR n=1 Tax=Turnera subulata TaxID=218843 RepID=A0A9Q0GJT3_9ROSI|nr:hypothetical protein Tsubulata_014728 [Turnera subulata]